MSQGIKISNLPDLAKQDVDSGDYFVLAEKTGKDVWATRKVDAKFLLKLKTTASNLGNDADIDVYKNSTTDKDTLANVLNFRSLKAGTNIQLSVSNDNIVISNSLALTTATPNTTNNASIISSGTKLKNISGTDGLVTVHNDTNKVIVKPEADHYLFVPAVPSDPSMNPTLVNFTQNPTQATGVFILPTQLVDLTSRINALPTAAKASVRSAKKGIALVRIKFNINATNNVGHELYLRDSGDKDWVLKVTLDPTGGGGVGWEAEDSITTTVEFNKNNEQFQWYIRAGDVERYPPNWAITVGMYLEGFFV